MIIQYDRLQKLYFPSLHWRKQVCNGKQPNKVSQEDNIMGSVSPRKKGKKMFYGRLDLPSRIFWLGILNFLKNVPKNTKIYLKTQTFFAKKFWENILTYFQKFGMANYLQIF